MNFLQQLCYLLFTVIILMQQEDVLRAPVKPSLALSLISGLLLVGVVITLIVQGFTGFATTYTSSTTCNTYLFIKYETQRQAGFQTRFILAIISVICLTIETVCNIRSQLKLANIQQQKSAQILQWSQDEIVIKYVCQSIAIMGLVSIFSFYLSITIEEGACFKAISITWIAIAIQSSIALFLLLISWIILVKYSISLPQIAKLTNNETNIKLQEIKSRQNEIKNIFEMEGSEMYKTLKRENRDMNEPLLVQNNPIPLFPNQVVGKRKQSFIQKQYIEPNQPIPINSSPKNQIPTYNERKKSNSPNKVSSPPIHKSKISAMIQKRKNKFRQINPLKNSMNKYKIDEQQNEQQIVGQNMIKNLPKTFTQYIKQAKKPRRNPPNFEIIQQNYKIQEQARIKAIQAAQEKPFLKKYRKNVEQKKIQKKEQNDEIQFIDEDIKATLLQGMFGIQQPPQQQVKQLEKEQQNHQSHQPQLFFHKPRSDKNVKKKRKNLFQQDVIDLNLLDKKQQKQVIINKIKQAKNNKAKLEQQRVQQNIEVFKQPKRKFIKSKQDIMLSFLKSKYIEQGQTNLDDDV